MIQDSSVLAKRIWTKKDSGMIEVFMALGLTLIFGGVIIATLVITALAKK